MAEGVVSLPRWHTFPKGQQKKDTEHSKDKLGPRTFIAGVGVVKWKHSDWVTNMAAEG